jgi:hypothetical protein
MLRGLLTATALLLLAGCSSQPLVAPESPAFQSKIASAHQWQKLATRTADRLHAALAQRADRGGYMIDGKPMPLSSRPLYIAPPDGSMAFSGAFRTLLIQALYDRGYTVSATPVGAVIVNTRTQLIRHQPAEHWAPTPGTFTAIGTGIYVGRQAGKWSGAEAAIGGIALGAAIDSWLYLTDRPSGEMLVTTSVLDEARVLFQTTSLYYVDANDAGLYVSADPGAPAMLTRPAAAAPLPVKTISLSAR